MPKAKCQRPKEKNMKKILMIFLVMFMAAGAYADLNYDIRGSVREWVKIFADQPHELSLMQSQLKLEFLSALGENAAFKVRSYFEYEGTEQLLTWELKEAFIDLYSDVVDIRFGKQVISWGKADELNPTDILNPEDISNITEDKSIRKIGVMAIKADLKIKESVLTFVYIPEFSYHALPQPGSDWDFFGMPALPTPSLPGADLSSGEWALKCSKTIEMFDFSIAYFNGWDNIFNPSGIMIIQGPEVMAMPMEPWVFKRTQMLSLDFAGSVFDFGLWGEFAYFYTEDVGGTDPAVKNPYLQFVIGTDYTFPKDIKINIQYFHEVITGIDDDTERKIEEMFPSKLGLSLPVQQALSFRIGKSFGEGDANSIDIFGIVDLKNGGIMMGPKLGISPEDAVLIEFGAMIFDGREESIFNMFNRNDELYVKATYSF